MKEVLTLPKAPARSNLERDLTSRRSPAFCTRWLDAGEARTHKIRVEPNVWGRRSTVTVEKRAVPCCSSSVAVAPARMRGQTLLSLPVFLGRLSKEIFLGKHFSSDLDRFLLVDVCSVQTSDFSQEEENKHEVNREQPSLDPSSPGCLSLPVKYVQRGRKSCAAAAESNLEKT